MMRPRPIRTFIGGSFLDLSLVSLLSLCAACEVVSPAPTLAVHYPDLGAPRVTAVNLLAANGVFLRSSNELSQSQMIPAGTKAEIQRYTPEGVDIVMNKVTYTMHPASGTFDDSESGVSRFLEKYFQARDREFEIEQLGPPDLVDSVKVGRVLKGMTKEQVYVAIGPPQWIDVPEKSALRSSRREILDSDRWVYTRSHFAELVPRKAVYKFVAGKLTSLE